MKLCRIASIMLLFIMVFSAVTVRLDVSVKADTVAVALNEGSTLTLVEKSGEKYVYGMPEKLTAAEFLRNFKGAVKFTDEKGNGISGGSYVMTGGKVVLTYSGDYAYAVVSADVNGSGTINVTDYLQIKRHILATYILSGASLEAADIDRNGRVDTTDVISLKKHFIKTSVIGASFTNDDLVEDVFSFMDNGALAVVKADGVIYTASGYEGVTDEKFIINKGFTADVEGINESFNRMTFKYASSEPLRLSVTYESSASDTYYLEAADDGAFSCLISSYLDGKKKNKLVSFSAETCTGQNAEFMISGISVEEVPVISKQIYYLENSRYKVGIKLAWGGGITYISEKNINNGFTNLVNNHDVGRMIQQSYYGTAGNDEYTPGTYNGSKWAYNPVQGGDQYNNSSRLIDVSITSTSVYIKSQPQDWSLNNKLTPSYMENIYTISYDYIRVDNRFTDFSGWEHRYAHQELPALYTVSGLSRFNWYDGVNSWQNDAISYKDDLNFWGNQQYANDCYIKMREGNTETWCAWTSPSDNYGLGLYVPNIDILLAGRYQFNNTKNASAAATNYVAPLDTIRLNSFKPLEYSYLITTGSVDQIRSVFKENKDFADNASLHYDYKSSRIK